MNAVTILLLFSTLTLSVVSVVLLIVGGPPILPPNQSENERALFVLDQLTALTVNETRVDTESILRLVECEQYLRDEYPKIQNETNARLNELLAFNATLDLDISSNITATWLALLNLGVSGTINTYQTGKVNVNGGRFQYSYAIRGFKMGLLDEFFYVSIPMNATLISNVTTVPDNVLVLDDWIPTIGVGYALNTRVDPVMDRQQEKIQSAPTPLFIQERSYLGNNGIVFSGLNNLTSTDYVAVLKDVVMVF